MNKQIKIDKSVGIGIEGLLSVLCNRTHDNRNKVGLLTDVELLTVCNQASNLYETALNGLDVLSELTSAFNEKIREFNTNGASWIMQHLTELLRVARELESEAELELARRGFDRIGTPLKKSHLRAA